MKKKQFIEGDSNVLHESVIYDKITDHDEIKVELDEEESIKSKCPEPSTVPTSTITHKIGILKRKRNITVPFDNTTANEASSTIEKTRKVSISSTTTDKYLGVASLVETTDKKQFGSQKLHKFTDIENDFKRAYEKEISHLVSTRHIYKMKLEKIIGMLQAHKGNDRIGVYVRLEENGQSFAINIDPEGDLLSQIHKVKPIDAKAVFLTTNGKVITPNMTFKSLGLQSDSTINFNHKLLGGLLDLSVNINYQRTNNNVTAVTVKIDPQLTIRDLKELLFKETKIPSEFIILMRGITELEDTVIISAAVPRRDNQLTMHTTFSIKALDEIFLLSQKFHETYGKKIELLEAEIVKYKQKLETIARDAEAIVRAARTPI